MDKTLDPGYLRHLFVLNNDIMRIDYSGIQRPYLDFDKLRFTNEPVDFKESIQSQISNPNANLMRKSSYKIPTYILRRRGDLTNTQSLELFEKEQQLKQRR